MRGGGAGGRGSHARTSPASWAASPDPAAHQEARPAGWASEPGPGTGETRVERAARSGRERPAGLQGPREPGMRGGERVKPASPAHPAGKQGSG